MLEWQARIGSWVFTIAALSLVCACGDDGGAVRDTLGEDTGLGPVATAGETGDSSGDGDGDDEPSTTDGDPCQAGYGDIDRFIWIANSGQGTVSKIDTVSGVELGRYIVRPDSAGSPSRTSVNNRGDVVVANRLGGVTMIRANADDCVDINGTPGIQTSTGPDDVLPWGQDDCVAWHTPIPHIDNRPVAWTTGFADPDTCQYFDRDVWTAWSDDALGTAAVALLDGETGEILQEIPIPELPQAWSGWFGFYGGAVDNHDNLWVSQLEGGLLAKISRSDFSVTTYPVPAGGGYGMTVTPEGYVWICGRTTHRFDPETETWDSIQHFGGGYVHTGGCMGDGKGLLWRAGYQNLMALDTETLEVVKTFPVTQAGDDYIWGVAIDFDGYVWAIPRNGSRAYKVSPETESVVLTVNGLISAYTYSDMTGFALSGVGGMIP